MMHDRVITVTLLLLVLVLAVFIILVVTGPGSPGSDEIDEATAVGIVKSTYPELGEYPSDRMLRSLVTERSDDGWYVAFIQEGSGRPILAARCYHVDRTRNVRTVGTYAPGIGDDSPAPFSARTCTPGACGLETCHGLEISCGPNPPEACTAEYAIGDVCLPYARCGVRNGTCGPVENASFSRCRDCVRACIDANRDPGERLFECESRCGG